MILADNSTNVAIGLAGIDMSLNDIGGAIASGVLENVDTSAYSAGTILYVNGVGDLTSTEPTTGFAQPIAFVLRSHLSQGDLQVLADYPKQDAEDVRIDDTGGYFASNNVEFAIAQLGAHEVNTSNPHSVTAAQLSLGTSDSPTFAGLTITGLSGVLKAAAGVVSGSATTSDMPEGTNLYYTEARVSANTDVAANTTHRSSDGTDHTYIDQDLRTTATPEFAELGIGTDSITRQLHISGSDSNMLGLTNTSGNVIAYFQAEDTAGVTQLNFGPSTDPDKGRIRYENANDSLSFYTSNSRRLLVDTSGNVGIGINSPEERLHVSGGDILLDNNTQIKFDNAVGTPKKVLTTLADDSVLLYGYAEGNVIKSVNGANYIYDNAGATLQTLKDGNVGIGVTTPQEKLHMLDGDFRLQNTTNGDVWLKNNGVRDFGVSNSSANDYYFRIQNESTGVTNLTVDGNVGVGTTSPGSYKLAVNGGDVSIIGGTDTRLLIGDTLGTDDYGQLQWDTTGNYLSLETSGTSRPLVLQQDGGKVGIGTDSPDHTLHVDSAGLNSVALFKSTDANAFIYFQDGSTTSDQYSAIGTLGDKLQLATENTARLTIDQGDVGIGTDSPSWQLTVAKAGTTDIAIQNTTSAFNAVYSADTVGGFLKSNGVLRFGAGSSYTEYVRLIENGNFGIGTTAPSELLEIAHTGASAGLSLLRNDASINDANTVGYIRFKGADPSGTNTGAQIVASAAGAWGTGDYPTDILLQTDNNGSQKEQVRISNTGYQLEVNGNIGLSEQTPTQTGTPVAYAWYNTADDDDPSWIYGNGQSWHDELGDFPRLALLVLETYKLTIYDATDPSLPSWMVMNAQASGTTPHLWRHSPRAGTAVSAANGFVYIGLSSSSDDAQAGKIILDFCSDKAGRRNGSTLYGWDTISDRDSGNQLSTIESVGLVHNLVNDVALTLLPDTPIDPIRKMRTPTVAVGTDGGVSVIHADGTVTDSNRTYTFAQVTFNDAGDLFFSRDSSFIGFYFVRSGAYSVDNFVESGSYNSGYPVLPGTHRAIAACGRSVVADGSISQLSLLRENVTTPANGAVAYITSDYNTGWMHGDIKGCWLSDTVAETVGVDESTELVTNGTFDTDTDWTKGTDWSIGAGVATKAAGAAASNLSQTITTVAGGYYEVEYEITAHTAGTVGVYSTESTNKTSASYEGNGVGTYKVVLIASGTSMTVRLRGTNTADLSIDNVSVIRTGNLIENGEFTYNTDGWTAGDAASGLSVVSNKLRITNNDATSAWTYQSFTAVVGETYVLTFDFTAGTSTSFNYGVGTSAGGDQYAGDTGVTATANTITFVATATTSYVYFQNADATNTYYSDFDNVSIRLADPDRSVNDNGLEVYGQFTKSAVATGADLMGYKNGGSGASLRLPYNADLDYDGTSAFHAIIWAKTSNSSVTNDGLIGNMAWGTAADPGGWALRIGSTSEFFASLYDGTTFTNLESNISLVQDVWQQVAMVYDTTTLYIYVDGKLANSVAATSADIDQTVNEVLISANWYDDAIANAAATWDLALARTGLGAPTADDIAAFYADEKHLFNDNATCTLPGSSDVVNDLAYNRWKEQLHIATGAGKAIFKGLINVEEDTTAAVTVIDALGGNEAYD